MFETLPCGIGVSGPDLMAPLADSCLKSSKIISVGRPAQQPTNVLIYSTTDGESFTDRTKDPLAI